MSESEDDGQDQEKRDLTHLDFSPSKVAGRIEEFMEQVSPADLRINTHAAAALREVGQLMGYDMTSSGFAVLAIGIQMVIEGAEIERAQFHQVLDSLLDAQSAMLAKAKRMAFHVVPDPVAP